MSPRAVPCTECRRQSVKCIWPAPNETTCLRCSKKSIDCSGPERKSPKPCVGCKKARARCVRNEGVDDCERCLRKGSPCETNDNCGKRCGSESSSDGGFGALSPASEKLSEAAALQMLDIQLALEGQVAISILDRTCIFLYRSGSPLNRRAGLSDPGEIDNVITLLFVLAGAKYTTAEAISGSPFPTLTTASPLPIAPSSRRTQAVSSLSRRIIDALSTLSYKDVAPRDLARYVASIELAWLLCVMDAKEAEDWRKLLVWGVSQSVIVLNEEVIPKEEEDFKLLRSSAAKLAFREGVESAAIGRPSSLSSTLFHLSCFPSSVPAPTPTSATPSVLTPLFTPSLHSPVLDPDLQFLLRDTLLAAHLTKFMRVCREITSDFKMQLRSRAYEWWDELDECSHDIEAIIESMLTDPRRFGPEMEERVSMATRSIFANLDSIAELDLMICSGIIMSPYGGRHTGDYLYDMARNRMKVYVRKAAKRTGLILNGANSGTALELYYPIWFLTRNLKMVLTTDGDTFQVLSPVERDWLVRMLRFASFWDKEAGDTSDAIEESMKNLSLKDSLKEPGESVARRMVDNVLMALL